MPWVKFHSDHFTTTWKRVEWIFHRIWITMKELSVKWASHIRTSTRNFCWSQQAGNIGMCYDLLDSMKAISHLTQILNLKMRKIHKHMSLLNHDPKEVKPNHTKSDCTSYGNYLQSCYWAIIWQPLKLLQCNTWSQFQHCLTLNMRGGGGDRINSVQLNKHHGCWCPGHLRRQDISNHDVDYVE